MSDTHVTAPTQYIEVDGDRFAYRRWGKPSGIPIFLVQHFRGGMDHWDPLLTDGLAEGREVILFNGRGIASSSGKPRNRMEDMADDIAAVIRALGLEQVDLLGFSIGGYQVEEVALRHPQLVRKLLLLGTGLRGGDPTSDPKVPDHALNPVHTLEDFLFLFFKNTPSSQAAGTEFLQRLGQRTTDRDAPASLATRDAQLTAWSEWGIPDKSKLVRLNALFQPVLVADGDSDILVPPKNSQLPAKHLPNAQLSSYPNAGHGFLFQYHGEFASDTACFLDQ